MRLALITAVSLCACGDGGGYFDRPRSEVFVTAPHEPFPLVHDFGGPRLSVLELVTVTFADEPERERYEAFGDWIVSSKWLHATGADYGLTNAVHLAKVHVDSAPTKEPKDALLDLFAQGVLQPPSPGAADPLFVLYLPAGAPADLCGAASGYHDEIVAGGRAIAYAVVCPTTFVDVALFSAAHEIVEAVSDPFPFLRPAFQVSPTSAWVALAGAEIADLCELEISSEEDGYTLPRVWSTTAASAGKPPCIPAKEASPYFNVSLSPADNISVRPGQRVEIEISGWSDRDTPSWSLLLFSGEEAAAQLRVIDPGTDEAWPVGGTTVIPGAPILNNGERAKLLLEIADAAPPGAHLRIAVVSLRDELHAWPLQLVVR